MDFQREFVELTLGGVRYYGIPLAILILLVSAWSAYQDIRKGRERNQVYTEFGIMAVIAAVIAAAIYKLVSSGEQNVRIQYYGIIIVTAMLVATVVAATITRRVGRDPEHVYGALTWAIIPGIVVARLWFVLFPSIAETEQRVIDAFRYTVTVQQITDETLSLGFDFDQAGLIVPEISPAAEAGLKTGDTLVRAQLPGADEYQRITASALQAQVNTLSPGDEVKLEVEREVPRDRSWFLRHFFDTDDGAITIWNGGLSVFGALIGGVLGTYIYLRKNHLMVSAWLDIGALVVPLAQAIGRWANYVNQELYGKPTCSLKPLLNAAGETIGEFCDSSWGLNIPSEKLPEMYRTIEYYNAKFHPLFLYESIWSLLAFAVLVWVFFKYRNRFRPGDVFLVYIAQYSFIRFLLEFLRVEVTKVGDVNLSQLVAGIAFVVCAVALAYRHRSGVTIEPYDTVAPSELRARRVKPKEAVPITDVAPGEEIAEAETPGEADTTDEPDTPENP